jgi:hypothetical protein
MYFTPFMLGKSGIPVSSNLLLHYDATNPIYVYTDAGITPVSAGGQIVYRWKSTVSNDYYQQAATPSNRPTFYTGGVNGKSYVWFDGVNDCMEMLWNTKFATNAKSFFAVMTPLASNAGTAYPFFFSFGQATKGTDVYMYNNSPKYWEWSQGGWTIDYARSLTTSYVQGSPRILIGRSSYPRTSTGIKLWVSGSETANVSVNTPVDYGTPRRAIIGGEPDGNTTIRNKANFAVYEFGFFDRDLTNTETVLLSNFFRTKYGIL